MAKELLALVVVAASVLALLVGGPGSGASWLTAGRVGEPVVFRGVVRGEARLEEAGDGRRRVLLDLGVRPEAPRGRTPIDLVVLVDASNSMRRDGRLALARRWFAAALAARTPVDRVAVVAFRNRAEVLVPLGPPGAAQAALDGLRPEGPTDLASGLAVAQELGEAARHSLRVLVLAGGEPNHGPRVAELAAGGWKGQPPCIVDLAGPGLARLAQAWGGPYLAGATTEPERVEELLGARVFAVRDLRLRVMGPAASHLAFSNGAGHLILGGGSLGDLAPGAARRLVAEFPARPLAGPLAIQLDYLVPGAPEGWESAAEGGTLHF